MKHLAPAVAWGAAYGLLMYVLLNVIGAPEFISKHHIGEAALWLGMVYGYGELWGRWSHD